MFSDDNLAFCSPVFIDSQGKCSLSSHADCDDKGHFVIEKKSVVKNKLTSDITTVLSCLSYYIISGANGNVFGPVSASVCTSGLIGTLIYSTL